MCTVHIVCAFFSFSLFQTSVWNRVLSLPIQLHRAMNVDHSALNIEYFFFLLLAKATFNLVILILSFLSSTVVIGVTVFQIYTTIHNAWDSLDFGIVCTPNMRDFKLILTSFNWLTLYWCVCVSSDERKEREICMNIEREKTWESESSISLLLPGRNTSIVCSQQWINDITCSTHWNEKFTLYTYIEHIRVQAKKWIKTRREQLSTTVSLWAVCDLFDSASITMNIFLTCAPETTNCGSKGISSSWMINLTEPRTEQKPKIHNDPLK